MTYSEWPTDSLELARELQIARYNADPHEFLLQDIGAIVVELAKRADILEAPLGESTTTG